MEPPISDQNLNDAKPCIHFPGIENQDREKLMTLAAQFEDVFSIDWLLELCGIKTSKVLVILNGETQTGRLEEKQVGFFCFRDFEQRKALRDSISTGGKKQFNHQISKILILEAASNPDLALPLSAYLLKNERNDIEGCRWLSKAGKLHVKMDRYQEAMVCYEKAIEDLKNKSGGDVDPLLVEIVINYFNIPVVLHDSPETTRILKNAIKRTEVLDNIAANGQLQMHLASNQMQRGNFEAFRRHFNAGKELSKEIFDPGALKSIYTYSIVFYCWTGHFNETIKTYETAIKNSEIFPKGLFPLYVSTVIAYAYAAVGRVNHGLGMLDTIIDKRLKVNRHTIFGFANLNIGLILFNIGRTEDVYNYLTSLKEQTIRAYTPKLKSDIALSKALVYFERGKIRKTIQNLKHYIQIKKESWLIEINHTSYPLVMEICWMIELGKLPSVDGFSLKTEIRLGKTCENIFYRGIAFRYEALLILQKGTPPTDALGSLQCSLRWLRKSGHELEIAKTNVELARFFLITEEEKKARKAANAAAKIYAAYENLEFPDDLKILIRDINQKRNLLETILQLGSEVATIRNNQELGKSLVLNVIQITGAERGAIFLIKKGDASDRLTIKWAENLTDEDTLKPKFSDSMDLIRKVAKTGKGIIKKMNYESSSGYSRFYTIRSCICVPMIIKNEIVGVLYFDNRFLSSLFKESDLKIFTYFAAQAAIALDNMEAYEEVNRLNQRLDEGNQYYREQHLETLGYENFIGESAIIKKVLHQVSRVAKSNTTVLITGETGVGKELIAGMIFDSSERRDKPYIRVNCSTFSESLIASELFGHEKGAFTGASEQRVGRFELADGGTLFLDEVGDIPMEVQVRLLRVLQTKEFERVGGSKTHRSDFRLITATNQNLQKQVQAGKFRQDLYYRLNIFPIHVPSLKERSEDIPLLAHHFLRIFAKKLGKPFTRILESGIKQLISYNWPGNVRELENVIERSVVMSSPAAFKIADLNRQTDVLTTGSEYTGQTMAEMERQHIFSTLKKARWKISGPGGAAEILDLPNSTLRSRMKKLGIDKKQTYRLKS